MISDWIPDILFYAYAAVLLASALAVITVRNSVHAALLLVLAFFSAAALWMLLEAEFLAITLVLVYVGAVMVLFLFVVMMLDVKSREKGQGISTYGKVAIGVTLAMLVELAMLFAGKLAGSLPENALPRHDASHSNVRVLAEELFTRYVFPFELAAVLLLVAIVAAILLTLRRRPDFKHLDPARQVAVKASDRMRVIKMPAETTSRGDAS